MSRHHNLVPKELKVKKNTRTSKLNKQRTKNLKKLKQPKVRLNSDKEDFSEDLKNLFSNNPIVIQEKTFQNVTSDYTIDNIKEIIYLNTLEL